MDTTTDGIENTRVVMRKPSMRLSGSAVEALGAKSVHVGSSVGSTLPEHEVTQ